MQITFWSLKMFLHHLVSQTERNAFYQLAQELVAVDGRLQQAEREILELVSKQANLDTDTASRMSRREAIAAFISVKARRAAILELVGISLCDGNASAGELDFIRQVAQDFGLDVSLVSQMRAWAERMLSLTAEGESLVADADSEVR